ncbi:MAG: hypothetical protein AB1806_19470 [Acidobacteriota bacterium]
MAQSPSLTSGERAILLTIAPRIVPASAAMSPATGETMMQLIGETLVSRTPAMRRQWRVFLAVLRWAPFFRYLRPLERLDGLRQDAVLRWFQDHRLQVIRGGFWGVRTLVLLGYYGQPGTGSSIAYTPSLDGNGVLRARARR